MRERKTRISSGTSTRVGGRVGWGYRRIPRVVCWFLIPLAIIEFLRFEFSSMKSMTDTVPHEYSKEKFLLRQGIVETQRVKSTGNKTKVSPRLVDSCAICFFGLPRSFRLLVLPSIIQNVLIPNRNNRCDIFLHYHHLDSEGKSRSGSGGILDTEQVWLLHNATTAVYGGGHHNIGNKRTRHTENVHSDRMGTAVHLSIIKDTNETFWKERGSQIEKYKTTKIPGSSTPLYYPWKSGSYNMDTMYNIIKQWHSISSVWEEMERTAPLLGKRYTRVAMLRNDVVYVTPFDIYQISNTIRDDKNEMVVVPNWARFPINDRMVYGPFDAIRIWATERFDRLEKHVQTYEPGYGLHSERFLNHSIFPAIRELGFPVVANPEICFFRARADGSTWINDCTTRDGAALGFRGLDTQALVERLVGHPCVRSAFNKKTVQLHCNAVVAPPNNGSELMLTNL
jgi:hypothetical protein